MWLDVYVLSQAVLSWDFFAKSYCVSDVQCDVTADLRVFSISEGNALKKTEFVLSRH